VTDSVSGLFRLDLTTMDEYRLHHESGVMLADPCVHPKEDLVACALRGPGGVAHIAVATSDGRRLHELTEGDVVDGAPAWVPGEPRVLVYQSAGVGRDARGFVVDIAPVTVQQLDFDRREIVSLLEDPHADFLAPRCTLDGTLWAMRRPRVRPGRTRPLHVLADTLLFPFRLGRAMLHYLNFFSIRYGGTPLITAGGTEARRADLRRLLMAANMIDAARGVEDEEEARVAPSWTLVRRRGSASLETVATAVACYDVLADGTILYADGAAVHALAPDGSSRRLFAARGAYAVIGLHGQAANSQARTA